MRSVEPEVFLVARPKVDYEAMAAYLREVGGERWLERLDRDQLGNDAQDLAEFAGKMCYRSWEPGLHPNVRRVRGGRCRRSPCAPSGSTSCRSGSLTGRARTLS